MPFLAQPSFPMNKKAKAIVRDRLRLYAQLGEDQS
jgi:hypothetical protein